MERTTRTNTFESTSARKNEKAKEAININDAPEDAFQYNSQLLGLSNNEAPTQKKANPEEEVQMKASEEEELQMKKGEEEEVQMKPEEEELQMKPEEEELQMKREDDEKKTQLKEANTATTAQPTSKSSSKTAMPEAVQAKMENSFGADFSNVNIHKDSASATQMGAQAYAQGNDVHFAPGKYNPNTQGGQELLGHELAHVVQQRQGRVNGAQNKVYPTKQSKGVGGANINNDTSLEHEADVMGAKAAKGQPAKVSGKGSGVQGKFPSEVPKKFGGLDVIGYGMGDADIDPLFGGHKMRLLLSGNASGWRNVLKNYADRYHSFDTYILPFLSESGSSRYGVENSGASSLAYSNWKFEKNRGITKADKLEFMKALYDTDSKTSSEVDLTDSVWEADANVMSFVNPQWEGLAEFIKMNQHMIIEHMAKEGDYFDKSDISNLAEQGHTSGQALANTAYVIKAIVQNAVSTSVNSVKSLIHQNDGNAVEEYKQNHKYIEMVKNASKLASFTIDQYGKSIGSITGGAGKVFDAVWSTIPFGGPIAGAIAGEVKDKVKEAFGNVLNVGGEYAKPKDLKVKLADQFDLETNKINDPENSKYFIDAFKLATIQTVFRQGITQ